jgi:hypothetical protein
MDEGMVVCRRMGCRAAGTAVYHDERGWSAGILELVDQSRVLRSEYKDGIVLHSLSASLV